MQKEQLQQNTHSSLAGWLILFIVVMAFAIRATGTWFGLPYIYSADAHLFVNPALNMIRTGDLNPHWYGAGTFVIYCLAVLWLFVMGGYMLWGALTGNAHPISEIREMIDTIPQSDPTLFYLSGRLLMVVFAAITVYIVYLLGKRLFNQWIGLLAAFCMALSPLHILHSRYIRPDIPTTMLVVLSIYFLFRFYDQNNKVRWLILSSLFAGFSIAAKYTSGIVIVPILLYVCINDFFRIYGKNIQRPLKKYILDFIKLRSGLSLALICIFLGYFIFAPFTIIYIHKLFEALAHEARSTHLGAERLPGIQNHLWYFKTTFLTGVGNVIFEILAGAGFLIVLAKRPLDKRKLLFLLFPVLLFVILGFAKLRWERWLMPIVPFEAILFAVGVHGLYVRLIRIKLFGSHRRIIQAVIIVAILWLSYPALSKNIHEAVKMARPDKRTVAKQWVEENLPDGAAIIYEEYTPQLHIRPEKNFKLQFLGWRRAATIPLRALQANFDYLIITHSFKDRYYNEPQKYPAEIAWYEALKRTGRLIKTFDDDKLPGPTIEIYRLR